MLKKELSIIYAQKRQGLIIEGVIDARSSSEAEYYCGYSQGYYGDFSGDKNILTQFDTKTLTDVNGNTTHNLCCMICLPEEIVGDGSTGYCFGAEIVSKVYIGKGFFIPYFSYGELGSPITYPGIDRKYILVFNIPNKISYTPKDSGSAKEIELTFPVKRSVYEDANSLSFDFMKDGVAVYEGTLGYATGKRAETRFENGEKSEVSLFVDLSNMQALTKKEMGGKHLVFRAANRSLFREAA